MVQYFYHMLTSLIHSMSIITNSTRNWLFKQAALSLIDYKNSLFGHKHKGKTYFQLNQTQWNYSLHIAHKWTNE